MAYEIELLLALKLVLAQIRHLQEEECFEGEDSHLGFDDSVISPGSRKRKNQGKMIKTEEDLNMSQVSFGLRFSVLVFVQLENILISVCPGLFCPCSSSSRLCEFTFYNILGGGNNLKY